MHSSSRFGIGARLEAKLRSRRQPGNSESLEIALRKLGSWRTGSFIVGSDHPIML